MTLRLQWRSFRFALLQPLRTAAGELRERSGWLLRMENDDGQVGWGEVAPLHVHQLDQCCERIRALPASLSRLQLDALLSGMPGALGFGLGAAVAELEGLVGSATVQGWLPAPPSAALLPAGDAMLTSLAELEARPCGLEGLTLKWKVATHPEPKERQLLLQLLTRLPGSARLRLDANGGWDRPTARDWMEALLGDPRFGWLEQPLPPEDQQGLDQLAAIGPVALDESLEKNPSLRQRWEGWQVRRPALDGDPRPLLCELQNGMPRRMLSTAFETGIGRRWLEHLAGLQVQGPTPAAPGLAPGWRPSGALFSRDPEQVWQAAA